MQKAKLFIWGFYWQGNFGDDLMAIVIANYFMSKGYDVRVFNLPDDLARVHNIKSEKNCESGVSWCDVLVLGGGAFLKPKPQVFTMLRSRAQRDIVKEISKLGTVLTHSQKPIAFISIGSDSIDEFNDVDSRRVKILKDSNIIAGTIRIKKDIELIQGHLDTKNVKYFPDILFATEKLVEGIESENTDAIVISISSSKINKVRPLIKENKNIVHLSTHSEFSGIRAEYGTRFWHSVKSMRFNNDPVQTVRFLARSKLVISNKLHLGLVALALGKGFCSISPKPKTVAQLEELNLSNLIFDGNNSFDINAEISSINFDLIHEKSIFSYSQLEYIESKIESFVKNNLNTN